MLDRVLHKGPTVLGAQASSPARVPPNQQPLTELVSLDAGRRERLRSQDRGAFVQEVFSLSWHNQPRREFVRTSEYFWLGWLRHDKADAHRTHFDQKRFQAQNRLEQRMLASRF